jgi:uncharacterized membrane protein
VDVLGGPEQPVYVEALGRRSRAVTLLSLRRVVPLGEGGGCRMPPTDARVVARGNEPFWSVRVLGDRLVFSEPDAPDGIEVPAAPPVGLEGGLVYRSADDRHEAPALELVLEDRGCTDSMSGEYMHLTARVRVDGRTMSGCAYAAAEDLPRGWGS